MRNSKRNFVGEIECQIRAFAMWAKILLKVSSDHNVNFAKSQKLFKSIS